MYPAMHRFFRMLPLHSLCKAAHLRGPRGLTTSWQDPSLGPRSAVPLGEEPGPGLLVTRAAAQSSGSCQSCLELLWKAADNSTSERSSSWHSS